MRSIAFAIVSLLLAGCGSAGPELADKGPRIEASLAATWPGDGPARQSAFSRDGALLATSDASGLITVRDTRNWKIVEQLQRSAVGALVWRHHVNPGAKPTRVLLRHIVTGAAIENDGVRQVFRVHMVFEAQDIRRLAIPHRIAPTVERDR